MLSNELGVIEIIDLHRFAYVSKSLCRFRTCHLGSLAEDLIYLRYILLILLPSLAHRLEELLHYIEEELLASAVSKAATTIMSLHFIKIGIFRKIFREMLRSAECIEICEYDIALDVSGIGDLEMFRVSEHAVDLLLYFLGSIRQINAVAKRLAHLGFSVGTRQTAARYVLRKKHLRSDEGLAID